MGKLAQKVELTANILIILVALAIGGVLAKKYIFKTDNINQPQRIEIKAGTKLDIPDVNWEQQPKTLILALQRTCRFCNESTPFYQRLVSTFHNKNIKIVAVFPSSIEESQQHLNEIGLTNLEVRQSSLNKLNVVGTPTLILTNDKGEVTDSWVGKLSPDKEAEVINKLSL